MCDAKLEGLRAGTFYQLSNAQPAMTRLGFVEFYGYQVDEAGSIYLSCKKDWDGDYSVFDGLWVDAPAYKDVERIDVKQEASLIRMLRAFLEEKLDPKEIVKAEKLDLPFKFSHRYTGGWYAD